MNWDIGLKRIILVLSMTTALLATSPARAQVDLTEIVKKIQPAVTTIITYDQDEKILGQGTGFFIDKKGHLLTNYHVLKGSHGAVIKTFGGKVYQIKSVVAASEDADLIKVSVEIPEKAVKFVQISRTVPQVAERVLVVGSPMGLEQTVTEGIVSAVREIPSIGKFLQLSAAISPGSSGSPVVNMKSEVVGVATFQLVEGQSLNFAVCSEQILALKSLPKAKSLAEWTLDFPDIEAQLDVITDTTVDEDTITDIAVDEGEVPDKVQASYARYDAAKKNVEEALSVLAKALKTHQPTSKTVAEIRERLKQAQADLDKLAEDKRRADEVVYQLLEDLVKAKQAAYDELTKELLPSAPQAKALEQEVNRLKQRQMRVKSSYGAKPGGVGTNSIGMKLVWIPPGEFDMGSPPAEPERNNDEGPIHHAKISKGFWMGQTEVTQTQYVAIMGTNPSRFNVDDLLANMARMKSRPSFEDIPALNADLPVETVSWDDAVEFCRKLSEKEGVAYGLPTEAQWEYACRAGTMTRFSFDDGDSSLGDYAWYSGNSNGTTHPVGQKRPNAFGLYDMHGNVWELCSDWYGKYSIGSSVDPQGPPNGKDRVSRGGSWSYVPRFCRSASRDRGAPVVRVMDLGFRVVLLGFQ
jgi:formylglycine-generating enzyme required for sulfatase activity